MIHIIQFKITVVHTFLYVGLSLTLQSVAMYEKTKISISHDALMQSLWDFKVPMWTYRSTYVSTEGLIHTGYQE